MSDKKLSVDLSHMAPMEGNEEEVKEVKGSNILTWKKLFTRLPIFLTKAGNTVSFILT